MPLHLPYTYLTKPYALTYAYLLRPTPLPHHHLPIQSISDYPSTLLCHPPFFISFSHPLPSPTYPPTSNAILDPILPYPALPIAITFFIPMSNMDPQSYTIEEKTFVSIQNNEHSVLSSVPRVKKLLASTSMPLALRNISWFVSNFIDLYIGSCFFCVSGFRFLNVISIA